MSLKYMFKFIIIGVVILLVIIILCYMLRRRSIMKRKRKQRQTRNALLKAPQVVLLTSTEFEHLHYGSSKKKPIITCQKRLSNENYINCSCNCKNCLVEMEPLELIVNEKTLEDNYKKRENEYVPNPIISLNNPQ